jgi:hypothetical protein
VDGVGVGGWICREMDRWIDRKVDGWRVVWLDVYVSGRLDG